MEACAYLGMVYVGDQDEVLHLRIVPPHVDPRYPLGSNHLETNFYFRRLHVLEFTSERKRMSVIVQDSTGLKWILTKGAESHVFPLCASTEDKQIELIKKTDLHIGDFARLGLRTLVLARKKLSEDEYQAFWKDLQKVNQSLENRKELSRKCYAKVENGNKFF